VGWSRGVCGRVGFGQHGGPVRAEHPFPEKDRQHFLHEVFAHGHGRVVGVRGGVPGVGRVVRAPVVDVVCGYRLILPVGRIGAGEAAHPPPADAAADTGRSTYRVPCRTVATPGVALAALFQVDPARLDVPVIGDDVPPIG
jgi:hypothetical protein